MAEVRGRFLCIGIRYGMCAVAAVVPVAIACGELTPLPQETAVGLLRAPVQATWAANHAEYWRDMGFRGFLLQGICDTLPEEVWARDGDAYSAGEDDALLKEVKLACSRLAEFGLDRHFAFMQLAPDAPWFLDERLAAEAVRQFGQVGRFCRLAGLRGLALESDSLNPLYTHTWDGYDPDLANPDRLVAGARRFGRGVLRAFVKEFPDGELLIAADTVRDAGPLWFDFVEGMVEGIGAADSVRIHLLTRESARECNPVILPRIVEHTRSRIRRAFGAEARAIWDRFGTVALGLRPLGMDTDGPIAYSAPEAFRVQVAAAKVFCERYFCIDSPSQAWWQVLPEQADQYRALYQAGARAAEQVRPTLPGLDRYTLKSPVDSLRRVGPLEWNGARCDIFRGARGAAAVFWGGYRDPLPTGAGQAVVRVVELATGKERSYAVGESETGLPPAESAVLVEPLPESAWLLPACLRAVVSEPLDSGHASAKMTFGIVNPFAGVLHGALQAWPPEGFSLGAALFQVDLEPGASRFFERRLRGMRKPRLDIGIDVTLALPESRDLEMRAIKRRFAFDVAPGALWQRTLDGPPLDAPLVADVGGDGAPEVLVTDRHRTACHDMNGALLWEKRWRATPAVAARPVRGRLGEARVAVVDRWGILRTLDATGRDTSDVALKNVPVAGAVLFANLFDAVADVVITGEESGTASCYTLEGDVLWRTPLQAPPVHVTWAPEMRQVFVLCMDGTLQCLDRDGKPMWGVILAGAPSCEPLVYPDGGVIRVVAGTANGHLHGFNAEDGRVSFDWVVAHDFPVTAVCAANVFPDPGVELVVGAGRAVLCLNAGGQPVWKLDLPDVRGITTARVDGQPLVLISGDFGIWACNGDGKPLWRDTRADWGVPGTLTAGTFQNDRRISMVYAGADGVLRWIELGAE